MATAAATWWLTTPNFLQCNTSKSKTYFLYEWLIRRAEECPCWHSLILELDDQNSWAIDWKCFYVTLLFSNGRLNFKSSPANADCFKPWEVIPICTGSLLVVLRGPLGPVVALKQHRLCGETGSGLLQNWDERLLFKCMLTTKEIPRVSVCIHFFILSVERPL